MVKTEHKALIPKVIFNLHIPLTQYEQLMQVKPDESSRNAFLLSLLNKGYFALGEETADECQPKEPGQREHAS